MPMSASAKFVLSPDRVKRSLSTITPLPPKVVPLAPNGTWVPFLFGGSGTQVPTEFLIIANISTRFTLVDLYCTGDIFVIRANGTIIGTSSGSQFDGCRTRQTDPNLALANPLFSNFSYTFSPGAYLITLYVLRSQYQAGVAAVRLQPAQTYDKCCLAVGGLTVVRTPVLFASKAEACAVFGLTPADLIYSSYVDAGNVIFGCLGPNSKASINSWNTDRYNQTTIVYQVGSVAGAGSVVVPGEPQSLFPVLCQGETQSCNGPLVPA